MDDLIGTFLGKNDNYGGAFRGIVEPSTMGFVGPTGEEP